MGKGEKLVSNLHLHYNTIRTKPSNWERIMEENKKSEQVQNREDENGKVEKKGLKKENYMTVGLCVGICFGSALGQLFGNIGLGISIGMCLGIAVGASLQKEKE
jgi:F0F1-type ATP synthase assembly protein I